MFFLGIKIKILKKLINKLEKEVAESFRLTAEINFKNIDDIKSGKASKVDFFSRQPDEENRLLEEMYEEFLEMRKNFDILIERFFFENKKTYQLCIDFRNYLIIYKNALSKISFGCQTRMAVEKIAKDEIVRRYEKLKKE